ncbi:hypothetical protein STEG23_020120 [Scotinomys teguina]
MRGGSMVEHAALVTVKIFLGEANTLRLQISVTWANHSRVNLDKNLSPVTELPLRTQLPPLEPLASRPPRLLPPSRFHEEKNRMSAIQNLHSFDPFADASKGDDLLPAGTEDYIHIRIQQRNGRKTLTTVQGIADDYDKKKLVKAFKKKFVCNGTVIEHPEYGEVIQLQGDQRKNICQFLIEIGLAKDDQLKVRGF